MQILKAIQREENLKRVNGGSMAQWVEIWFLGKANLQFEPQFCHQLAMWAKVTDLTWAIVSSYVQNEDSPECKVNLLSTYYVLGGMCREGLEQLLEVEVWGEVDLRLIEAPPCPRVLLVFGQVI